MQIVDVSVLLEYIKFDYVLYFEHFRTVLVGGVMTTPNAHIRPQPPGKFMEYYLMK